MAWNLMPRQQQRGAQIHNGGAPKEAVQDRAAQQHDMADLQVAGTTEPQRDIDYPADGVPERSGDITPTLNESSGQSWDDVVQPENHSRQAPTQEQQARTDFSPDQHEQPLPEGK